MRVLLYSTTDCGLCDAFHYELLDLQTELGFAYEKCHLTDNDPLFDEFVGRFPVVHIETTTAEPVHLTAPLSQRELRLQVKTSAARSIPQSTPTRMD